MQATASCRARTEPVATLRRGFVDYQVAWREQRAHASARVEGPGPDVLMLLEHPSVYTAGRRTRNWEKPLDGTPVVDVDRGGKITWHGPGQLVGYPLVRLADPIDVLDYVRRVEEGLIELCARLGVVGGRVAGRTGVWLPADERGRARKVAAIGVRVQRGVTMHGFSLNCNPDLAAFGRIVPCGITDAGVTSLSAELGREVRIEDVIDEAQACVLAALDGLLPVREHSAEQALAQSAASR
jgi:lipoyl(octanoyl) transferase